MDILTKFISKNGDIYNFPEDQQTSVRDNFRDLAPSTERLAGVSGAFSHYGSSAPPSDLGSVQHEVWYEADTAAELDSMLRDAAALVGWGEGRLYKQPMDISQPARFCWATPINIPLAQNVRDLPHKRQKLQFSFQVTEPYWLDKGNAASLIGVDFILGTSLIGGGTPDDVSDVLTTLTYTVGGNMWTPPQFALRPLSTREIIDPIIRRVVAGEVVDELAYFGRLTDADNLVFDCRKQKVTLNGEDMYTDSFNFKHPAWMRFQPGANTIQVKFAQGTDTGKLNTRYYHRWV